MASLTSDAQKALLTPPIAIPTNLPFPVWTTQPGNLNNPQVRTLSSTDKIVASVCSEFTNYDAPVAPISATHKLAIIQDSQGQPIVFSIGTDDRLYCARHIQGGSNGWLAIDITPTNKAYKVTAFDATQDITSSRVNLAVAASTSTGGVSDVYTILGINVSGNSLDWTKLPWIFRPANLGPRIVSTMQLCEVAQIRNGVYPFVIVGTAESNNLLASNYVVSLDLNNQKPWSQDPLAKVATKVVQLSPGHIIDPLGFGVFSLFQDANFISTGAETREGPNAGNSCSFNSFPTVDADGTVTDPGMLVVIRLQKIGATAKGLATLINNRGDSDLVVAGSKGLGYYPSSKLSLDPVAVILPNIDFQQVVAAQWGTKISLLATSTSGQLYHIEGSRMSPNADPTFTTSQLPIREHVALIAVQKNNKLGGGGATEFVCVEADGDVMHVWKDPGSSMWAEQKLVISSSDKQTRTPAFVSQIQLSNSKGTTLGEQYNITLTASEACYVTINSSTYQLNPTSPVTVPTDTSGQLRIIYPADVTLGAPQYACGLSEPTIRGSSATFAICPVQRIVGKLAQIRNGSDIRNATSTTGQPVFPSGAKDSNGNPIKEGTFDALASTIFSLPNVLASIGANAQLLGDNIVGDAKNLWVSLKDDGSGGLKIDTSGDRSILNKVKDFFTDIGDFIVSAAKKLVAIANFVISVAADVVLLVIEVKGTVLKFAVRTVAALIRSFAIVLQDALGIDILKYLDWLGFILDWDNILKTQKVLANFVQNGLDIIGHTMSDNGPFFKALISSSRQLIQHAIPDMRVSQSDGDHVTNSALKDSGFFSTLKQVLGTWFDLIFNNPIAKGFTDIITRILVEITKGLGDLIVIPGIDRLLKAFANMTSTFMKNEAAKIGAFISDIYQKLQDLGNGKIKISDFFKQVLGDGFWTLFDTLAILLTTAIDIFGELMSALFEFFSGVWKIPVISGLWKFFTNTDLSIVNVLTIPFAFVLNIIAKIKFGKLPFDAGAWGDPMHLLPSRASVGLDPGMFTRATAAATTKSVSLMSLNTSPASTLKSVSIDTVGSRPSAPGLVLAQDVGEGGTEGGKGHADEIAKLQKYRISDAACGTIANILGVFGVMLEIFMLKFIPEVDVIKMPMPTFALPLLAGVVGPNSLAAAPSMNTVKVNISSLKNSITRLALAVKIVLDVCVLGTHVKSLYDLGQVPMPEPRKTEWMGMKGGIGIPLVLAAIVSTIASMQAPPNSQQRRVGLFVSGVLRSLGNVFHTSVTGCWEFDWSDKDTEDSRRFGADFCELFGSVASGVAAGLDFFEAGEIPVIVALGIDGATAISSLGTTSALINDYRKQKGLEETGKLQTQ